MNRKLIFETVILDRTIVLWTCSSCGATNNGNICQFCLN